MISTLNSTVTHKNYPSNVKLSNLSKRYIKAVESIASNLDSLQRDNLLSDKLNNILSIISGILKEDFSLINFVEVHYVNLNAEVKNFFGEFNFFQKIRYCNDKNKLVRILKDRIEYFVSAINLALCNEQSIWDEVYLNQGQGKVKFAETFQNILINLYDKKGFRQFKAMNLTGLDFANKTFEGCNFSGSVFDCNLENTKFISCKLDMCRFKATCKISNLTIDKDSSLYLTSFNSPLDLLYIYVFADIKKLRYVVQLNKNEENLLLQINNYIKSGLNSVNDPELEKFSKILSGEEDLNLGNSNLRIILQCPISLGKVNFSDLCGINYNNIIRLYSAKALIKWLTVKRQCPFRMDLVNIQKSLLNLEDIKGLLCQIK